MKRIIHITYFTCFLIFTSCGNTAEPAQEEAEAHEEESADRAELTAEQVIENVDTA